MVYKLKIFLTKCNFKILQQDKVFQLEIEKLLAEQEIQNPGQNYYSNDNTDNTNNTNDYKEIQNDCFPLQNMEQYQVLKNNNVAQSIECNYIQFLSQNLGQTKIKEYQDNQEIIKNKQEDLEKNEQVQYIQKLQTEKEDLQTNRAIKKDLFQQKQKQYFQLKIDVIVSASISFDEKYLGFCSNVGQLQIFIIEENKFIKLKDIKSPTAFIFKPNSHELISGNHYGWIFCFDGLDQFNIKYQQQIHTKNINCIIFIDEFTIITCSNDKQIIITDLKYNQQLLKISDAHLDNAIFIDYYNSMKWIASCSIDQSIKLWNLDGNLIQVIDEAHKDFIIQIQIIQAQGLLLSLCMKGELKLWEFQQQHNKIEFKSQIEQNETVLYFHYFEEKSLIILVCQNHLKILNFDFQIVKIINNNMTNHFHGQVTQANPGNVFIINGEDQIIYIQKILEQ